MKKAVVIIDGSNLYFKLKAFSLGKKKIDYQELIKYLTGKIKLQQVYYCVGKVKASQRSKKARKMMAKQQAFITALTKTGFKIRYGYLLKSGGKYHEKGVDVQMAVDILRGAYKDEYDALYLLSSDSDLIPAIEEAQKQGKIVVYVGFKHEPSHALLKSCKQSMLLEKQDIKEFIK